MRKPILFQLFVCGVWFSVVPSFAAASTTEFQLSKDGVGPIYMVAEVTINGRDAVLKASARNDSGQPIRHAKFCVAAEDRTKGCDFELWTTTTWRPGEELKWVPLKATTRIGTDKIRVALTQFDAPVNLPTSNAPSLRGISETEIPSSDGGYDAVLVLVRAGKDGVRVFPSQLISLKKAGVSDAVILAMIEAAGK